MFSAMLGYTVAKSMNSALDSAGQNRANRAADEARERDDIRYRNIRWDNLHEINAQTDRYEIEMQSILDTHSTMALVLEQEIRKSILRRGNTAIDESLITGSEDLSIRQQIEYEKIQAAEYIDQFIMTNEDLTATINASLR